MVCLNRNYIYHFCHSIIHSILMIFVIQFVFVICIIDYLLPKPEQMKAL